MKNVLFLTQKSCGPCRKIEPTVVELCNQYGAKLQYIWVDTDAGKQTAQMAGEFSTPVVIILDDNGNEITRLRNAQPILDGLPNSLTNTQTTTTPKKKVFKKVAIGLIGLFFLSRLKS